MRRAAPPDGFPRAHRLMHWTVLVLCLVQVPTAWAIQRTHMMHLFMKPRPFDLFLHQVHAWSGWAILGLVLAQLVLRFAYGRPAPVEGMSVGERIIAAVMHAALYGVLIALPVTGTIAMYVSFRIAPLHSLLSWTLLTLVLLHAGAALWHHFWRSDAVLWRMLRGAR
ncbi:Cytochrome b561 [Bosea sp. 62]|uniref:cytochrome b n=1 Tax=unclassified Bosea (in: a-proteobacteria) TaxID=2653178 RepID=UPI0012539806|nr:MULTISPECIES: cytochrome b/b6 domain-containing protein [unclassified Bosea (in: a-proteobacteria)]CAD5291415.1 Cytochrome b561 [Bosea sp. 21B]CAD5292560.1 Cytochrome b561 [Bosea sp. 46]CAD5300112.1 Cytochrome b561 [Bosea sp. 7B]VVT57199.1 Cytochrome b561 [Bosea sp. EC-HK365B]VXB50915.1 Cytochrome b561 [Bosea sp. 127]